MMYLWAWQYPVTDAMEEAEVDRRTACSLLPKIIDQECRIKTDGSESRGQEK